MRLSGPVAVLVGLGVLATGYGTAAAQTPLPACPAGSTVVSINGVPTSLVRERTYRLPIALSVSLPGGPDEGYGQDASATLVSAVPGGTISHPATVTGTRDQGLTLSVHVGFADDPVAIEVTVKGKYLQGSTAISCQATARSAPIQPLDFRAPVISRPRSIWWGTHDEYEARLDADRGVAFRLSRFDRCINSAALTVGPLTLRSDEACQFDEREVRAPGGWRLRVRGDLTTAAIVEVSLRGKQSRNVTTGWSLRYAGETLRSGRLRFERWRWPGIPSRKIFADTNVDGYINFCINNGKQVYSQQGGRLYCWKYGLFAQWLTRVRVLR